jgi:ornithine cyclodeaminase/alanine dehydrogenase-like protein (mu-crystallin family)
VAVPHIEGDAIAAATPWPELIAAVRAAFASPHQAPDRHIHTVAVPNEPAGTALLMPAWIEGDVYGVKLANIFPGNGARGLPSVSSLYAIFSAVTGQLLATLDGSALTGRRTAATSALASSYLSRPDSRTLLIVGGGRMAPMLAAAHRAVRPIERVLIWTRDAGKGEATAAAIGIEATAALEPAVREADIVSTATLAQDPLIFGSWLQPGQHFDIIGSYSPLRREVDADAVARSSVFVDTIGGAKAEAGDLIQAAAEGRWAWSNVRSDLAALATGRHKGRRDEREITLFKSVGAAIEDLAAARLVLRAEGIVS